MDTKPDEKFLAIEVTIESNKQESDNNHKETADKITLLTEKCDETTETLKLILATMKKDKTTFRNPLQPRRIHRLLRTLPPRSRLTRGLHH